MTQEIKIIDLLKFIEKNINEIIYSTKSKPQIRQALRDLNTNITKVIKENEVDNKEEEVKES